MRSSGNALKGAPAERTPIHPVWRRRLTRPTPTRTALHLCWARFEATKPRRSLERGTSCSAPAVEDVRGSSPTLQRHAWPRVLAVCIPNEQRGCVACPHGDDTVASSSSYGISSPRCCSTPPTERCLFRCRRKQGEVVGVLLITSGYADARAYDRMSR
ncbi:hypothetical protein MRX96_046452 [Rhipicephalus microplus]